MVRRDLSSPASRARVFNPGARLSFWLSAAALLASMLAPLRAHAAPVTQGGPFEHVTVGSGKVAIYNLAGACVVEASTGSQTIVEVMRGGAQADRLKLASGLVGDRQTLRVLYPERRIVYPALGRGSSTSLRVRSDGTFGGHDSNFWSDRDRVTISGTGGGCEAHADLRVSVPSGADVLIRLATGDVRVTNVDSRLAVDLAAGSVATSDTRGELTIDTGSGDVHVARANGPLSIDTGSGGVTVKDASGGTLSIDTGSGDVDGSGLNATSLSVDTGSGSVDLAGIDSKSVHVDTGSGRVSVQIESRVDHLSIDTGSGSVEVSVPKETSAMLALETGSGSLAVDLPVTHMRRDHGELHGQLGDGSGRILIDTGSGGIHIAGR